MTIDGIFIIIYFELGFTISIIYLTKKQILKTLYKNGKEYMYSFLFA